MVIMADSLAQSLVDAAAEADWQAHHKAILDAPAPIIVRLLGPLEMAGHTIPTASKMRQTLALLASHPGQQVTVDAFIEEIWGDGRQIRKPKQSVETYIMRLRRFVHIERRALGYALMVDPMSVDAVRFMAFVDQARSEARDPLRAQDTLLAAFSLWSGPVLEDVTHGPLLSRWVSSVEDRYRTGRQLGFDVSLQLGRHREVLDDLHAELRAEWTREDVAQSLMLALYRSQRRVEALNVYRTVREALAEEHGLDPCPGLARLQQQILAGDPSLELNGEH